MQVIQGPQIQVESLFGDRVNQLSNDIDQDWGNMQRKNNLIDTRVPIKSTKKRNLAQAQGKVKKYKRIGQITRINRQNIANVELNRRNREMRRNRYKEGIIMLAHNQELLNELYLISESRMFSYFITFLTKMSGGYYWTKNFNQNFSFSKLGGIVNIRGFNTICSNFFDKNNRRKICLKKANEFLDTLHLEEAKRKQMERFYRLYTRAVTRIMINVQKDRQLGQGQEDHRITTAFLNVQGLREFRRLSRRFRINMKHNFTKQQLREIFQIEQPN